ncbi:MAG TPA: hypothetical protein VJL54_09340 [Nitrososphaera sp.]|nr:hypothetical protein [Nitrososphaera sp.]
MITCGCRCISCKSTELESNAFEAADGYQDIHHTCRSCGTHFNHLDGETFTSCAICNYRNS